MKYVVYDPADYADIEVKEAAPEPKKWTLAHRVKTLEAEILRLRAENAKLRAALINLWAAAYDLPRTKECRLYNALRDADEVLKEA